jgi:hypothetical protein
MPKPKKKSTSRPKQQPIPIEVIEGRIVILRGRRVLIDRDLAELYCVETRVLNQAVNRNLARFPPDFMFQLNADEASALSPSSIASPSRSQSVILKRGHNLKYLPYVFTEHGAVMLANVLRSPVAVRASIQVVRAFVHLRQILTANQDLARKIEGLERKVGKHDTDLRAILRVLRGFVQPAPLPARRPIGFVGLGTKSQIVPAKQLRAARR